MTEFQTLNEVLEAGTFIFKNYGESTGSYINDMMFSGLTETEKKLVKVWFGDRCICSESPDKFQKYFDRLWSLYVWQYRNMASAWFGKEASDFKDRIIGAIDGENFSWNTNFLVTIDTAINGITTNTQSATGNSTSTTLNGGAVTTTENTETNTQKGGSDTTTTSGTSDNNSTTTNSGSDTTKNTGKTTGKNIDDSYSQYTENSTDSTSTEGTTKDTKLAGSTTTNKSINKNNPMSIVNTANTDGSIPTLDWTYATGQDASESVTTPDGKTDTVESESLTKSSHTGDHHNDDHGEHSSENTSEDTSTITHGAIVEGESSTSTSGNTVITYGATDRTTTESQNKQIIDTNGKTTGETSGTTTGNGSSDTTNKGRTTTLAALYGEFMSLLNVSPAWKWMMDRIEPAFLAIYDI